MTAETGFVRCENGQVLEMDLPLSDAFAGRLKRGEIVRVNSDGTPYDDPAAAAAALAKQAQADELAEAVRQLHARSAEVEALVAELAAVIAERDQLREALAEATKVVKVK